MYVPYSVLVPEMVSGQREFVSGLSRDPQFGPCVMFGLGGIITEIIGDVNFRVAPLNKQDAVCQIHQIKILEGVRG
ncbi:MAG: acetate--CoA ligase family protein, partial [Deltaproteobacteria bacterium]|nr:acetate--CoA ligase family protein [Deltaproteobacteria bacterium]